MDRHDVVIADQVLGAADPIDAPTSTAARERVNTFPIQRDAPHTSAEADIREDCGYHGQRAEPTSSHQRH